MGPVPAPNAVAALKTATLPVITGSLFSYQLTFGDGHLAS